MTDSTTSTHSVQQSLQDNFHLTSSPHMKDTSQPTNTSHIKDTSPRPTLLEYAKKHLIYDMHKGRFYSKKDKPREIQPSEDGYLIFHVQGRRLKVKANKAAYELGTGKVVPKDYNILHRNLDKQDFRLCNLMVVSLKEMLAVSEAHRNLSGELKLQPHHIDMFSYVVSWIESRQQKHKVVHDIVSARKLLVRLQLKYAKVLGKYLVLD